MNIGGVVLFLSVILLFGILAGTLVFAIHVIQLSKKYATYKLSCRETGNIRNGFLNTKDLPVLSEFPST